MKRLALFDCDGTLVDGQANHFQAMEQAFFAADIEPIPRSETRRVIGLSLLESMRVLAPETGEDTRRAMVESYKSAFLEMRGNGAIEEPLYEGMRELLVALDGDGWMLGVATGKSDRGLTKCLAHHGITDLFVSLQTADRHPSKPHPSMVYQAMGDAGVDADGTVMIGDTVYDIEMGKAAGCRTIAVGWGYHGIDEMHAAGAGALAETMAELKQILGEFT
ncbi:MAG: HAD-IA family hydrolase [Sphingorhabdus sp.]